MPGSVTRGRLGLGLAPKSGSRVGQEKTGSTIRKYYYFAGQRVAMREGSTVSYLLTDHLGSTSKTVNTSGTVVAELRYKPYGDVRYTSGTTPTNYRFTGQLQESSLNIYSMGARFYDPYVARFLSPDSIIPDPANPQSFNRYSYCFGNPLGCIDPSGHMPWWLRYAGWQAAMTSLSGAGFVAYPPVHGRYDVASNAETIRRFATPQLQLIVAASIAHQASDPKDRPFGSSLIDIGASQGIAQLQPGEIETWVPSLGGESRHDPEVAIRAMTGKLEYAGDAISTAEAVGGSVSKTDRYMLLALSQNCSTKKLIQNTVATFFAVDRKWEDAFGQPLAIANDWKEQLRLVVLHLDWLLLNGDGSRIG